MLIVKIIALLLAILMISGCSQQPAPEVSEVQDIEQGSKLKYIPVRKIATSSSEEIADSVNLATEETILAYFKSYYNTQVNLAVEDITDIYLLESEQDYNAHMILWEIIVKQRQMVHVDVALYEYETELEFLRNTMRTDGDREIYVKESAALWFNSYNGVETSELDIIHYFRLREENGQMKIVKHLQMNGVFSLLTNGMDISNLNPSKQDNAESLNYIIEHREELLQECEQYAEKRASNLETQTMYADTHVEWNNEYNRTIAAEYAMEWIDKRNPEWQEYDNLGGNCVNFTSQALFYAGIPMDISGAEQWKWFNDETNYSETKWGRSPSWSGVDAFYEYAAQNSGYGLVADVSLGLYDGDIGDIVQLGIAGDWKHQVIIVDVIQDESGKTIDYLINSNTANQSNFPLSAYSYPMQRLIKIHGWNE